MSKKSINPEKFALAVVASTSYKSITEKLEIYSEAYDAAEDLLELLQSVDQLNKLD